MLEVGAEAVMEFDGLKVQAMVRGWRMGEGGYLLTEKPNGKVPGFSVGSEAVVRIKRNGVLYGAAVKCEEYLKKSDLYYMVFSQDLVAVSLRKLERVACVLPSTVNMGAAGDESYKTVVVDLSVGGVKIISSDPMIGVEDRILSITFNPGGMGSVTDQKLKIVRVDAVNGRHEYCGRFHELTERHLNQLEAYLGFCKNWSE